MGNCVGGVGAGHNQLRPRDLPEIQNGGSEFRCFESERGPWDRGWVAIGFDFAFRRLKTWREV